MYKTPKTSYFQNITNKCSEVMQYIAPNAFEMLDLAGFLPEFLSEPTYTYKQSNEDFFKSFFITEKKGFRGHTIEPNDCVEVAARLLDESQLSRNIRSLYLPHINSSAPREVSSDTVEYSLYIYMQPNYMYPGLIDLIKSQAEKSIKQSCGQLSLSEVKVVNASSSKTEVDDMKSFIIEGIENKITSKKTEENIKNIIKTTRNTNIKETAKAVNSFANIRNKEKNSPEQPSKLSEIVGPETYHEMEEQYEKHGYQIPKTSTYDSSTNIGLSNAQYTNIYGTPSDDVRKIVIAHLVDDSNQYCYLVLVANMNRTSPSETPPILPIVNLGKTIVSIAVLDGYSVGETNYQSIEAVINNPCDYSSVKDQRSDLPTAGKVLIPLIIASTAIYSAISDPKILNFVNSLNQYQTPSSCSNKLTQEPRETLFSSENPDKQYNIAKDVAEKYVGNNFFTIDAGGVIIQNTLSYTPIHVIRAKAFNLEIGSYYGQFGFRKMGLENLKLPKKNKFEKVKDFFKYASKFGVETTIDQAQSTLTSLIPRPPMPISIGTFDDRPKPESISSMLSPIIIDYLGINKPEPSLINLKKEELLVIDPIYKVVQVLNLELDIDPEDYQKLCYLNNGFLIFNFLNTLLNFENFTPFRDYIESTLENRDEKLSGVILWYDNQLKKANDLFEKREQIKDRILGVFGLTEGVIPERGRISYEMMSRGGKRKGRKTAKRRRNKKTKKHFKRRARRTIHK